MKTVETATTPRTLTKLDLKQDFNSLYQVPTKKVVLVDIPALTYLMIDGKGNPNISQDYQVALNALYKMAFTLKFMIKKEMSIDYPVMPLEGLWWTDDTLHFSMDAKDTWYWTMMIMQPSCVTVELVEQAREQLQRKDVPSLEKIRLEGLREGLSAQIMHMGPYAAEGPTIARLHDFIRENGYALEGRHHEIYLGDPRRAAPEKLRTIIRQPVKRDENDGSFQNINETNWMASDTPRVP